MPIIPLSDYLVLDTHIDLSIYLSIYIIQYTKSKYYKQ